MVAEVGVAVGAWAAAVGVVATVHFENPVAHQVALFVHVVSLAVGFGGVATVDVHGLLWLLGLRTAGELAAAVTATHGLIAAGVGGLLASGAVLHPDLGATAARLKLTLVLVIVLNGVNARRFATRRGRFRRASAATPSHGSTSPEPSPPPQCPRPPGGEPWSSVFSPAPLVTDGARPAAALPAV